MCGPSTALPRPHGSIGSYVPFPERLVSAIGNQGRSGTLHSVLLRGFGIQTPRWNNFKPGRKPLHLAFPFKKRLSRRHPRWASDRVEENQHRLDVGRWWRYVLRRPASFDRVAEDQFYCGALSHRHPRDNVEKAGAAV